MLLSLSITSLIGRQNLLFVGLSVELRNPDIGFESVAQHEESRVLNIAGMASPCWQFADASLCNVFLYRALTGSHALAELLLNDSFHLMC